MSKELNIGNYVRFDYHRVTVPILIEKIVHIEYDKAEKHCFYVTDGGLVISDENIIKSSSNIIDLIEVGDYVNGIKVDNVDNSILIFYDSDGDWYITNSKDIKSIVTKEQFERCEYKL